MGRGPEEGERTSSVRIYFMQPLKIVTVLPNKLPFQTFIAWANMHLAERQMKLTSLEKDLCDGVRVRSDTATREYRKLL